MARPESEYPTELELEILKVLWEESPLPVRDVRARLKSGAKRPLAHSSVITMLNIMYRKGFLTRQKEGNAFLFSPKVKKEDVTGQMLGDLVLRVFGGSPTAMMMNLLETSDIDSEELTELRKLINRKSKEQKP
ncbi:BlaI/MecI/CopY family transcriptional regulator [Bremerella cremea]|uniref:Penicillinase repressor n=1 Tax=Blastopirellula marina TaxID=124 RepID=A0A2S8FYZ7_9BACT|nr:MULTISPECIES: BlaI/MecI/CopY family transcriptional regulator [Pirellulaceae]PQO37406.1 penicillinase repressor [Blastopirellula marina]RCS49793.1 BlaI/MecI/CopY family transcriptional regulator [Bremerella cremea]